MGKLDEKQYGVEGKTSRIVTNIRAYPEPRITWYFMGHEIDIVTNTDKYISSLTRAGELSLEIRLTHFKIILK